MGRTVIPSGVTVALHEDEISMISVTGVELPYQECRRSIWRSGEVWRTTRGTGRWVSGSNTEDVVHSLIFAVVLGLEIVCVAWTMCCRMNYCQGWTGGNNPYNDGF